MYYRSDEQVGKLLGGIKQKPQSRKEVYDLVSKRFNMKKLGSLKCLGDDTAVIQSKGGCRKVRFAPEALDLLFSAGAYEDIKLSHRIIVFGHKKKGRVIRFVALNRTRVVDWLKSNA
jgi:hypothetical protein